MLSGSGSILVETHPLFCLFGLLVFIPIERIEVGGAGGKQLAAISGDFCSSPHQIEGTEARGTLNRRRRVLLVDGGNTAIQHFIGKSPHQSNLTDVISPLVFSFVGVF